MNLGLPTIPTSVLIWGALAFCGFGVLAMAAKLVSSTKFLIVPEGTRPETHYGNWHKAALSKRIGRGVIFIAFCGLAMLLGGIVGAIVGLAV